MGGDHYVQGAEWARHQSGQTKEKDGTPGNFKKAKSKSVLSSTFRDYKAHTRAAKQKDMRVQLFPVSVPLTFPILWRCFMT